MQNDSRPSALRRWRSVFAVVVGLAVSSSVGCSADGDGGSASVENAIGFEIADPFPARESIEFAMVSYLANPVLARERQPMSVGSFFGKRVESSNITNLRVELLKPEPHHGSKPVAFLATRFHDGDPYWNTRYKDVQLRRLAEATNPHDGKNPFPEATYVRREGSALVRMWHDYRPVSGPAPHDLTGEALHHEIARIAVWSYVSGNADGPATNGSNGGFARFRDASGREFWQGVLIDAGAAWNRPGQAHKPWNMNLLGQGPVLREHIPEDVSNSLIQIARASADQLVEKSKFETVDDGARDVVRGIRGRAQHVLAYYGISYS